MTIKEPDLYGFLTGVLLTMECLTLALWVNSPNKTTALLWALPLIGLMSYCGLYCLAKTPAFQKKRQTNGQ